MHVGEAGREEREADVAVDEGGRKKEKEKEK